MNVETRRWFKHSQIATWFLGENLRTALNKFYSWIDYMEKADFGIHIETASFADNKLLIFYTLNDKVK